MQIGVTNYTQNQTLGNNLQALQSQQAQGTTAPTEPPPGGEWLDDAVSWSDRLYELHELAETVQVQDVGFPELSQLRQALYERGWITPSQATALTEVTQKLSDRLTYQADDVLTQAMEQEGGQLRRLLAPVVTMIQNVQAVQAMTESRS